MKQGKNSSKSSLLVKSLKQKGLSFVELLTVVGIIGVLAVVGSITYVEHVSVTGNLSALQQIGGHVLQQMQRCVETSVLNTGKEMVKHDDVNGDGKVDSGEWPGCGSRKLLHLQRCEECETLKTSWYSKTHGGRICMTIKKGRFSQCVGYRALPESKAVYRFKINVNHKVCAQKRSSTAHSALWPYVPCDSHKDCCEANTDSACETENLICATGQGECQIVGTNVVGCR